MTFSVWPSALSFVTAFVVMEGVAWAAHRFLMHGPLWVLHRSHHEPGRTGPQPNDLFALLFASVAIALFGTGAAFHQQVLWWAGAGVTFYGVIYALVHDGVIHGRFGGRLRSARGPLKRIVQAHRLHHARRTRENCVSFGLLWPGNIKSMVRRLKAAA
jgi:beta-carotene 3-hydroxylase